MQECGECTLCCKLLETHDIPSPKGIYCKKCEPGIGCKIHATRPKECRKYQCMWSQMENVGIEMRPDNSHVLFDRITDDIICGAQDPDYELSDLVKAQISYFIREGFSVVIFRKNEKMVYVSPGHSYEKVKHDVLKHKKEIEDIINGRT
jgi:hypothetical protein